MSQANIITAGTANRGTERKFGGKPSTVRPISFIAAAARHLWRNKVAVELAERAGVSVRSAENYLAGDRDMNGNALVRLLQSDAGPAFLTAMIDELPPSRQVAWREELARAEKRARLLRELAELEG